MIIMLLTVERRDYGDFIESQQEYLETVMGEIESEFAPYFQLVSTTANLTGTIPRNISSHEEFLIKTFDSSQSNFVYGMGIWYEPELFQVELERYGPYVRYDNPSGGAYSLTYKWNTPGYDYHSTAWYRLLFESSHDGIIISPPYFDTDYTYVTLGKPFYRDGIKSGVITVDMVLPLLEGFFSQYDFSLFEGVYLTLIDDSLMFRMKPFEEADKMLVVGDFVKDLDVNYLIAETGIPLLMLDVEGGGQVFKFHGFQSNNTLKRRFFNIHKLRYFIVFILGCVVALSFIIFSRIYKQKKYTRKLTYENDQLRDEVRRRVEAESQLEFLAYHDPVTKMSNLNALLESVDPPKTGEDDRYLIVISLDNIRELSFILDRGLIDGLLKDFTEQLNAASPDDSQTFRGSGFTFYIVTRDRNTGESTVLAEMLLKEFGKTIRLHKRNVRFRIHVGLASFSDAHNIRHLLNMARSTISDEENGAFGRVLTYNSEIERRKSYLVDMDAEMGHPNFIKELRMVYQPIIRVKDRKIAGVEALVRWDSPFFKKTVSPAEFIPMAEENGHVIELGWFVMNESLKMLSEDLKNNDWFVSVNVSPIQFLDSGFPEELERLVASKGIDKNRLKLEITETSSTASADFFWSAIKGLIDRGFRLAIDDFGTGESSFNRLYSYNFDTLKIDRSLIQNIIVDSRNQQIFKSILQLGKIMDNNVIAEGIEHEEEHELLKSFGLKYAQGFLYSKPKAMDELV